MGQYEAKKFWEHFEQMPNEVQLIYMNQRFGELVWDISRDWEDYDIEYKTLERLKSQIEFFKIPSMVVHRDDIVAQYEGRDDIVEMKEKIAKLSYDNMKSIANRMTDMMMEQFNLAVKEAFECKMENEK